MEAFKFVIVGITAALLAVLIKGYRPEMAVLLSLSAGIILLTLALGKLGEIVAFVSNLAEQHGLNTTYIAIAMKITGIACLADMGIQICKDAGENAIAGKVELGSKLVIMILALPVIEELMRAVSGLLA